ncbi:MAG: hypothetical protein PWP43_1335 [Bacillota bacterium]|nr:hypothetical protein [Bacillota bacterium]
MKEKEKEAAGGKVFAPATRGEEEDMFGQAALTDGDRFGELIPSLHAWMPPEAMRERAKYMEEVTQNLAEKEAAARSRAEKLDVPPWPTVQSDQEAYAAQAAAPPRKGRGAPPGKEFLDEYSAELQPPRAKAARTNLKQPNG